MQVLIHTDNHIVAHEPLVERVTAAVRQALKRFDPHLTRVVVHLKDENGPKDAPHDQRCVIEARLQHRTPVSASHEATTIDLAVDGALSKLVRAIDSDMGRRKDKAGHATPQFDEPADSA